MQIKTVTLALLLLSVVGANLYAVFVIRQDGTSRQVTLDESAKDHGLYLANQADSSVYDKHIINTLRAEVKSLRKQIVWLEEQQNQHADMLVATEKDVRARLNLEEQGTYNNIISLDENIPQAIQREITAYTTQLQSEDTEANWDRSVTEVIEQALAGAELQGITTVVPTECRVTLCQLELVAQDPQQADLVEVTLMSSLSQTYGGQMVLHKIEDPVSGNIRVVMFYAKDGYMLPEIN